ncbi:hypothetical protein ACHAXN_004779 [Cyclotella atomus]
MSAISSPTSSPPPSTSSPDTSPKASSSPHQSRTINAATTSAAIAAALDATRAHQTLFPGLATLFFEGGTSIASKYASFSDSIDTSFDASSFLPSVEAVSSAALRSINDFPPYVAMSIRDSAPQLTLEDVVSTTTSDEREDTNKGSIDFSKTIRRFVVRGGMRGYRMSRASHGVGSGCYYYEAIVLGNGSGIGQKRPRDEDSSREKENVESREASSNDGGHVRLGWSTRLGDLQAPVGYDKYSYAVRDIMGSRVHNSRREDKWGGVGFFPGDVIGFAICLNEKSIDGAAVQTNHIRVYKNGVLMQNQDTGIAFDNIPLDTYFPAVSCYLDGAVQLNFGPKFVYPPEALNGRTTPLPISTVCAPPPTPEEAEETIISSSKEGRKIFLSKKTDEGIVTTFKQLVRTEAMVRREAYLRHVSMHKIEILGLRNERGLPTADLFAS